MATNLAGRICIGELNACLVRMASLDADCSPLGGTSGGIVTAGLVDMTADPDIEQGARFEPKNGCGTTMFVREEEDRVKRYNLSGNFIFHDWEMMAMAFGGGTILGEAGGLYSGEVIGYYDRLYNSAKRNGVYLEVIVETAREGQGDCSVGGDTDAPSYVGHIFGKAKLVPGSKAFGNDVQNLAFTGVASNNPSLFNGPWNDYPGVGYIPNTAHLEVGYSQAQFDAILATAGCGYRDLPAGS